MLDIAIIIAYLIIVLWIGLQKKLRARNIRSFALGDSPCSTTVLQISLIATFIDGSSTIGLAEKTFTHGLMFTLAICGVCLSRVFEAKIFVPRISSYFGMLSVSEIMGSIYGKNIRIFTAIIAIIGAIFVIAVQLIALGTVFKSILGIPSFAGILIGSAILVIYSSLGGIKTVTGTDIFQFSILIVAIPLLTFFSLATVGGFDQILTLQKLQANWLNNDILKDIFAAFLVYVFPALYPEMVQRFLMTQNIQRIKRALYINALSILPIYIMIGIIGVIAGNNYPNIEPYLAFPAMIKEVLPIGIKGIVVSGLLAVIMSSADSFLNTIAVATAHDILRPVFPKLSTRYDLNIAQTTTIAAGFLAIGIAFCSNSIFNILIISMLVWIPLISPGLMFGLLGLSSSAFAFWWGLVAGIFSWVLSCLVFEFDLAIGACLGSLMNAAILLYLSPAKIHWLKRWQDKSLVPTLHRSPLVKFPKIFLYSFKINIQLDRYYETIAGFTLIYPMSTVFIFSFNGYHLPVIYYLFCIGSALLTFTIILREIWPHSMRFIIPYSWYGALLLTVLPSVYIVVSGKINLALFIGLVISLLFLHSITTGFKCISILTSALGLSFLIYLCDMQPHSYPLIIIFQDAVLKCLLALSCIILIRNNESRAFNTLTGFVSHEISHSISSFHLNENLLSRCIEPLVCSYELARENLVVVPEISSLHLQALRKIPHHIRQNTERIRNNLELLSSKIENTLLNQCSVQKCIKTAIECFDPIFELDKIVIFEPSKNQDFIFLGQYRVFINVFHNLIHNAIQEINLAKRGKITISIDSTARIVTILDTARGVSKENLSKLFTAGFSDKPEGMGIGLNFCHNAMSDIGGTISCESLENQYAKFILTFPSRSEVI